TDLVNRATSREAALEDIFRLARLAAAQQATVIEGPRLMLGTLAEASALGGNDRRECERTLLSVLRSHPTYAGIGVFDRTGAFVCGTEPGGGVTASSKPLLLHSLTTTAVAVTPSDHAGRPQFMVAHPIRRESGEIFRVVVTANRLIGL